MDRLVFICLMCLVLHANGDVSKCSPEIMEKIGTFWAIAGQPKGILKELETLGKGALLASTLNDHITSKNLTEPECVYADITGNKGTYTVVVNKEETYVNNVTLTEADGVINIPELDRRVYVLFQQEGVTIYYICSPSGDEGPPEGGVAVALKKFMDPKSLKLSNFGEDLLFALDIELEVPYTDDCFGIDS